MVYLIIIVTLLILVLRYDINGKTKYRDECYSIMLIIFILISGLRWRLMVDTPNYIERFYYGTPTLDNFSFLDYPIGKDPLYTLINSIVKTYGGRFYMVQLIEASFVNILVFKFIKRYSSYIFTCLFFYSITYYLSYSMETMRASFSIALSFYAYDYILDKKWVKGYILLIIGLMFHAQTIILFFLPMFFFLRLNKKGIVVLVLAFFLGFVLNTSLGEYVELFEFSDSVDKKVSVYAESEAFGGVRGGLIRFLHAKLPSLTYPLFSLLYLKMKMPDNKLLRFEPFVMLGVAFAFVRINFEIAYRFVDHFGLFFILFYSEAFMGIIHKAKSVDVKVACIRAIVFFLPFFTLVGISRYSRLDTFYPYSSVIDKKIDSKREIRYLKGDRPPADFNEY